MLQVQQKVREIVIMGGVVFPPPLSTENELLTQVGSGRPTRSWYALREVAAEGDRVQLLLRP